MFIINQDSSCVAVGILKEVSDRDIVISVAQILKLEPDRDVIIANDFLDIPDIFNNAKIYIDVYKKPSGVAIYCMFCSTIIHTIITNWIDFIKKMAKSLDSSIFIETNKAGYITDVSGKIEKVKYEYYFFDNTECLMVVL